MKLRQDATIILILLLLLTACTRDLTRYEGITAVNLEDGWHLTELAWSPDGRQIAATVDTRSRHAIYIIDLETKGYQGVQEYDNRRLSEAYGAEWSPDGRMLVLYYPYSIVVDLSSGEHIRLASSSIVIVDADTGGLLQGVWDGSYATWGTEQDEIIVVDTDIRLGGQEVPVYQVNLNSDEAHEILNIEAPFAYWGFDLSSSGLLAYRNKTTLEITNITTGSQAGILEMDTTITSPTWSPDGQILAYLEDASNPANNDFQTAIYLTTPNISCRSNPLLLGETIKSIDWSPDGEELAFSTNEAGKIYFLDLTIGVGKELFDSYDGRCGN